MKEPANGPNPYDSPTAAVHTGSDGSHTAQYEKPENSKTRLPSTLLMVAACLTIANSLAAVAWFVVNVNYGLRSGFELLTYNGILGLVAMLAILSSQIIVIVGAQHLRSRNSYPLAIAAAVVAMATPFGLGFVVGFPAGIWTLVVLREPAVKRMFQRQ